MNSVEHENAFLRQHVPSEIYAQYIPLPGNLTSVNDAPNPSTTTIAPTTNTTGNTVPSSSATSSQPIPMTSLSALPVSTSSQSTSVPASLPPSSTTTNLPST